MKVSTKVKSLWFVSAGDTIEEDDVLAEVQNDKSVVEIPSPVSGTIEVVVEEGTVAVVGDVIVKLTPDAEKQFKGHDDDDASSKEEEPAKKKLKLKKLQQLQHHKMKSRRK